MIESVNLPLCAEVLAEYGGGPGLRREIQALGLDGVEGIWGGEDIPADFPPDLPEDYGARFGQSYGHILAIDRHRPWTDPGVADLLDRIGPQYVTHELAAADRKQRARAVRRQKTTWRKGGSAHATGTEGRR